MTVHGKLRVHAEGRDWNKYTIVGVKVIPNFLCVYVNGGNGEGGRSENWPDSFL